MSMKSSDIIKQDYCYWQDISCLENRNSRPELKIKSWRPEVFCKKCVFRNSAKFTEKHLCQSLFFNKVKKRLWHRCFPVNFAKFLSKNTFSYRTSPVAASGKWEMEIAIGKMKTWFRRRRKEKKNSIKLIKT